MKKHLIFEGAELAGKSWIMSQIYEYLEKESNTSKDILNGCHWFNCDNGIFGTSHGEPIIYNYLKIFNELKEKNLILEKFHISDIVYNKIYHNIEKNYQKAEKELIDNKFLLILIKFKEDKDLIQKRINDRLNLYPHYERIVKTPEWYIKQQKEYQKEFDKSNLKKITIETEVLPDHEIIKKILNWIK